MLNGDPVSDKYPELIEVMKYIRQNLHEPLTIEQLSRYAAYSPFHFIRIFKEQTGLSIVDTLNRMRILQAALLLEHTHRSAAEIAYDVGFHNYNHFINQFRKWLGTTPSAYRKARNVPHEES